MASPGGGSAPNPELAAMIKAGPPYAPTVALLGGVPTVAVDVPISAVFLFLFILGAAGHMTILQVNLKRSHKFLASGALFGFCMARISTLVMRIVWAVYPTNTRIAIAATVLVAAGVVILFAVNLIFAQRIVRALHPRLGWSRGFGVAFRLIYAVLGISLILLIALTIVGFYTLDPNLHRIARDVQLYGQAAFTALCAAPLFLVIGAVLVPADQPPENFGHGSLRTKILGLLTATTLLTLGAAFRLGTNALSPRPRADPAWYQSRACFYCFNFTVEILVVYLYLAMRVDRRFHVPNGSSAPGHYRGDAHLSKHIETETTPVPEMEDHLADLTERQKQMVEGRVAAVV